MFQSNAVLPCSRDSWERRSSNHQWSFTRGLAVFVAGSSRNVQEIVISAGGGAYMWGSILESLPVRVILDREERASPLMLCLGRSPTSFCTIGESEARRPDKGGPCRKGVNERCCACRKVAAREKPLVPRTVAWGRRSRWVDEYHVARAVELARGQQPAYLGGIFLFCS